MGAAASFPEKLNKEQAQQLCGDQFDEERFDVLAEEGLVDKETIMAYYEGAETAPAEEASVEAPGINPREQAEADAKADMANAESNGVDWKAVHSCVRWNKPLEEVQTIITSPAHANCVDTKNGNYPIHIAAQNGHVELVTWLVNHGAKVNVQNGTGQTPLHMSTSYDYGDVADFLKANGADGEINNWEGNPAKFGIDGDKDPSDPMFLLDSCKTTEQAMAALAALGAKAAEAPGDLDKGAIAMMGMQVKKGNKGLPKEEWTPECQAKFTEVMALL
ncbi:hypothetical protein TrCOL_g8717 [Triparma columacea]|uniref:Uncharacterized protein n=1 Tax=Triparma columacea TaxID=722753 RepID=A0A9W7GHE2_9STRA|nr:hypothetical protein TrCOL_g8717 [Triparma columacea]